MLETIRNAWKIADLRKKILYTLLIVIVFRIGSAIPVPFMNAAVLQEFMNNASSGSFMGYLNLMTGGSLSRATLFALGISPYITASIVIQLLTFAIPALENLSKEGADGQKKIAKINRYTTLGLSLLQAIAYYILNRNLTSSTGAYAVTYRDGFSGIFAAIVIVASFTAGSMVVVWLGEQIDKKGVGNGISMILFAGIISRAPVAVEMLWNFFASGSVYYIVMALLIIVIFLLMIWAIVIMTNAERRIPVQYAKKVVGRKMYGGQSSFIPIKVTMSGVLPVIFASALLSLPSMIKDFAVRDTESIAFKILSIFDYNRWTYALFYLVLIIAFNYFYIAIQYNPMEMANNLRKNSGTIPGIRPGQPTADFISKVISKITLVGALFIAAICIFPIIMGMVTGINLALGGTSIIIVVGVALDSVKQLESQMMMRHYKGFLE